MFFGSSNYAFNDPVALNDPSGADPWWEFGPNGASRLETTTDRWQRTGDANLSTRSRGPRIWNPWAGNQGKDGVYTGGWIPLNSFEGQMFYFNKFGADSRIKIDDSDAQQGDPYFGREDLANSYYTLRSDYTRMKHLLGEFLSGEGPERSLFYGSHPLTKGMKNSAVVQRAKEYYAANGNGKDMVRKQFDFYVTDVPFVGSDIEQFIGSARVSIYPQGNLTVFVVDNTTGRFSGSFDTAPDIPRTQGQLTPMGNIYQRFIWIEGN